MSEKQKVSVDTDFFWVVLFIFVLFWQQGGWYRIDCALGVVKACEIITAEKVYSSEKDDKIGQ